MYRTIWARFAYDSLHPNFTRLHQPPRNNSSTSSATSAKSSASGPSLFPPVAPNTSPHLRPNLDSYTTAKQANQKASDSLNSQITKRRSAQCATSTTTKSTDDRSVSTLPTQTRFLRVKRPHVASCLLGIFYREGVAVVVVVVVVEGRGK